MKITAAILTYNQIANDRADLFDIASKSLQAEADDELVVDNGSTDGTPDLIFADYRSTDGNTTSGHGTNLCARLAISTDADVCVLSDDDMEWHPGWACKLRAWYSELPDDILLTGCHLEPEYSWNTITGTVDSGGVRGLLRHSTGAASWTFRRDDWQRIGPVPQKRQGWGDVPTCERLRARGYRIAQIDLATHRGEDVSIWKNESRRLAQPLDRERWGI